MAFAAAAGACLAALAIVANDAESFSMVYLVVRPSRGRVQPWKKPWATVIVDVVVNEAAEQCWGRLDLQRQVVIAAAGQRCSDRYATP